MKRIYIFPVITILGWFTGCTPSEPKFSVGEPETIFSREHMVGVDVQGIDGSLYALNDHGQWKWFGTNLVKAVYSIGPRDNPFDSVVAKSELQGLPNAYTNTKFGFAEDHLWGDGPTIANVYLNPDNGHILGFFHTEWTVETKGGIYFRLGLSISKDGGKSFHWCGAIIEPELTYDTWYNQCSGRRDEISGFSNIGLANYVIKDGYFYIYYADTRYEPNAYIQGTAVARARVEDVLAAAEKLEIAPWNKYYQGEWQEPGLNGKFTALNLEPKGFLHGDAAYNSYLDKFVLITRYGKKPDRAPTNTGAVLISFSKDGIEWSDWQVVHEDNHLHDYPSIISMGDNNEILGKSFWVYYKYCYDDILPDWNWYKNRWDRVLVTME